MWIKTCEKLLMWYFVTQCFFICVFFIIAAMEYHNLNTSIATRDFWVITGIFSHTAYLISLILKTVAFHNTFSALMHLCWSTISSCILDYSLQRYCIWENLHRTFTGCFLWKRKDIMHLFMIMIWALSFHFTPRLYVVWYCLCWLHDWLHVPNNMNMF